MGLPDAVEIAAIRITPEVIGATHNHWDGGRMDWECKAEAPLSNYPDVVPLACQ